jgi:hypothetical protein
MLKNHYITGKVLELEAAEKDGLPFRPRAFDQVLYTIEPINLASYDETSFEVLYVLMLSPLCLV